MKKINNFIISCKNNDKLIFFGQSLLIYISLCLDQVLTTYNILSFVFILIIYLFIFNCYHTKINFSKKWYVLIGILFSLIYIIGKETIYYFSSPTESIVFHLISKRNIIIFVGYSFLFSSILRYIFALCSKIKFKKTEIISNKKIFIIACSGMLLVWGIYFLCFFPGILTSDSFNQLNIITSNFEKINDHHPVFHTLLISIPYYLTFNLTNNMVLSIAAIVIFQMIIMAICFSYVLVFLNSKNVPKKIICFFGLIYIFSPLYGYYSITLWKDVLFGTFFCIFLIQLWKFMEKRNILKRNDYIYFFIISLIIIFLRNNAIYMYMFFSIFAVIYFKNVWKNMTILLVSVIAIFFLVKGPIFKGLNITNTSSTEYIAIPLQQMGRIMYQNKNITNSQKKKLDKLLPLNMWNDAYNPYVSDGLKFNNNFNIEIFNENKTEYALLWLELVKDHFNVAVDSFFVSTVGYWYPNFNYWTVIKISETNNYDIDNKNLLNDKIKDALCNLDNKQIPILSIQWSIGTAVWIAFIAAIICFIKKEKNKLLLYVPIMGIWLTMLAASPVSGEFRYMFCLFTSLPLLLTIPFVQWKGEKNNDKKN